MLELGIALASLAAEGEADGGSAEVCKSCVTKVATDAMYAIENGTFGYEQVTRFNLQDGRHTTAAEVCGSAGGYDIYGETNQPEPNARCADCGNYPVAGHDRCGCGLRPDPARPLARLLAQRTALPLADAVVPAPSGWDLEPRALDAERLASLALPRGSGLGRVGPAGWAAPAALGALGRRERAMSLPAWLLRSRLDQLANLAPADQGAPVALTELDASGGYFTELR